MLHIFDIVVFCCLNIINVETDRVLYDNIHLFTLVGLPSNSYEPITNTAWVPARSL
jgi:hypothetical protein